MTVLALLIEVAVVVVRDRVPAVIAPVLVQEEDPETVLAGVIKIGPEKETETGTEKETEKGKDLGLETELAVEVEADAGVPRRFCQPWKEISELFLLCNWLPVCVLVKLKIFFQLQEKSVKYVLLLIDFRVDLKGEPFLLFLFLRQHLLFSRSNDSILIFISYRIGYVEFHAVESVEKAITLSGQKLLGIPIIVQASEAEKNLLAEQAA